MKVSDLGKAAATLRGKEGGEKTGNTVHLVETTVVTLLCGIVAKSTLLSQLQGLGLTTVAEGVYIFSSHFNMLCSVMK